MASLRVHGFRGPCGTLAALVLVCGGCAEPGGEASQAATSAESPAGGGGSGASETASGPVSTPTPPPSTPSDSNAGGAPVTVSPTQTGTPPPVGAGGSVPGGAGAPSPGNDAGGTPPVAAGGMSGAVATGGSGPVPVGGGGGTSTPSGSADSVTRSESTYTFQHYPIETNADDVWSGAMTPGTAPTSTTFDTVILENGYLRVTILPDYGGRVLSIVHKPTDTELLYQNPVGAPYLMYEGIFYYDYLVILGGIFPSFPEPEHGKYWNQPYAFEVVSETPEAVTVRMSRQDDRDVVTGVPERYEVGRTDVLVEVEVTLRAGSSALEFDTRLTNTLAGETPPFEYWTVTTLAPGSPPGDTAIPLDTRILADMDQVHLLESSWAWFGEAEERVSGEVFRWNNLSFFENWADQGTAFANPDYRAGWSGLVNYQNDMGILRVSDNVQTPGLKLWTFGIQSLDVDISDSTQWLRPTIEMWHGVTPEFWTRRTMAAGEVREWGESYFPTFGLREVSAASEYGAVYLSSAESGADTVLTATATLTVPNQAVTAILRLDGAVVAEEDVVVSATEPNTVSVTVPSAEAPTGAALEAEFLREGESLLLGQIAVE